MLIASIAIFLATLTLVIWQPRGLKIGWSALGGAIIALATSVVHLSNVPTVVGIVWNATLTFVAVIIISLILDEAGFFEWAALHVARWGRGNGHRLFTLIIVLGAAIAAVFANDGAALILTPIVLKMLRALKLPAVTALAFIMATGFIADTTSLPLVVSNLVNIVSADYFALGFARYALVMIPVTLVSLAASLLMLRLYYRRHIPARYDLTALAQPATVIRDRLTFRVGWIVLGLLLAGYFAASPLGIPLAAVAGLGAIVLVFVAARRPARLFHQPATGPMTVGQVPALTSAGRLADVPYRAPLDAGAPPTRPAGEANAIHVPGPSTADARPINVGHVIKNAPWQVVLFSIGMYLVVYGLRNQGLTGQLAHLFEVFGRHGTISAALGTGGVIAGLSSIMNNMPTVLVGALGVHATSIGGTAHQAMIYGNVIGADLGPKITPIGSLATLLWLHVLDRDGIHIGWGRYFRTGIVLTLPVLAATLLGLAGWLAVVG